MQHSSILSLSCAACIVFVLDVTCPLGITRKSNYKLQFFIFNIVKYEVPLNSDTNKIRNPDHSLFSHP